MPRPRTAPPERAGSPIRKHPLGPLEPLQTRDFIYTLSAVYCDTCKREKQVLAKGMCAPCYMRKRRQDRIPNRGRAPIGFWDAQAMLTVHAWRAAFENTPRTITATGCHVWEGKPTSAPGTASSTSAR